MNPAFNKRRRGSDKAVAVGESTPGPVHDTGWNVVSLLQRDRNDDCRAGYHVKPVPPDRR
jgi:hypothetical protein